ncbi:MAG: MATE family efflux transporter [Planctomycetota bacterium]|nr:MATE family efflux transporter [Planctomycetota bacterium]
MSAGRHTGRVAEVARLAWPAALSFLLNNAYRINDQFWIQGLGSAAQAAIGAVFFVVIMGFAVIFLAVGGTLSMVSRAVGANAPETRDSVARHAILFAFVIGLVLMLVVRGLAPGIVALLGLEGESARFAEEYLHTLYLFAVPLAVFPTIDNIFFGRGNTLVPMTMQIAAVALNYLLNPLLIYGPEAAERMSAPGVALVAATAESLGIEGHGIKGAAIATGLSRTITVVIALAILRFGFGMKLLGSLRPKLRRIGSIARISLPSSLSIGIYAGVYWALFGLVLHRLGQDVKAGLGIGFQVFEGVAFPTYLGLSVAGATLVGRALGAQDPDGAWRVVRSTRFLGRILGLLYAAAFLLGGPFLVSLFTQSASVERETVLYVTVLAFSQYWVAVEAVNERVLIGSGHTGPIAWISPLGNLLRIPLAWFLALTAGFGAVGVWWAINLTTFLKAGLLWRTVQNGKWVHQRVLESEPD